MHARAQQHDFAAFHALLLTDTGEARKKGALAKPLFDGGVPAEATS